MTQTAITEILKDSGLNNLEADIYLTLIQYPGLTGYKIAGKISKPVANTYKALNQLESKGLIVCNESEGNKLYSAIEIEEYFNKLENDVKDKKKKIADLVSKMRIPQKNFGNFNLADINQTYERARHMIDTAQEVLIVDCFPIPYEVLKNAIIQKEKQKTTDIRLKLYHNTESICEHVTNSFNGDFIVSQWIGQWLCISKDGTETLIAAFSHDSESLIHAIWTTDPFICFTAYNGMLNEFMLVDILNKNYKEKQITCEEISAINNIYNPLFTHEMNLANRMFETFFRRNKE